jgi:short-subunit dehydrogenase
MSKTALITGGSSGIGLELAKLFARDGVHLILIASNQDRLNRAIEELRAEFSVQIRGIACDLAAPNALIEAQALFDKLKREEVVVDFLVNNAGFGVYGKFLDSDLARELEMVQLHVAITTLFTKLFARDMAGRGGGRIMNVASTAAFQPGPWMAVYYATKAYMLSYSEAAHESLKGTGVTVTCLCPGPTPTNFQVRAKNSKRGVMKLVRTPVEFVARKGYHALMKGEPLVIPGFLNRCGTIAVRLLPRKWVASLSAKVAENS